MTKKELIEAIRAKKSFLCVGLDTDILKVPECVKNAGGNVILNFNKAIIDATAPYAVAYKPNVAFYECQGAEGWKALKDTCRYIKEKYPDIFIIADAKRGDIGNTSKLYARAFFEDLDVDAVTVAPYMGEDSVTPFLEYEGKWVILLDLTSNKGSKDFQMIEDREGTPLYQRVLETSKEWAGDDKMMYVVGATKAEMFEEIRKRVPHSFLLVPGVGAQGGTVDDVCRHGINKDCGLLINSSRGIIYASKESDFAERAGQEAMKLQQQMEKWL